MPDTRHLYRELRFHAPVYRGQLLDFAPVNHDLLQQYLKATETGHCRQTHFFNGRFENTYIDLELVPALLPVFDMAKHYAGQILHEDMRQLKQGFWFNAMPPGHNTSLHTHEEYEEKLSAVYYIAAPPGAGDLLVHDGDTIERFTPAAGEIILFEPEVPHEVDYNNSAELRLSVAFNFGL